MGQTIQSYVNYLEYLKKEMSDVVGITPQREGSISSNETVGGVERATVQSAHITEWLFAIHNDVKRRVYETFLEVAKVAMQGQSKKFSYILSDNSLAIMDIDGDEFAECDYGLAVDYSNEAQTLKQSLEALAQAALQNQALSFSSIMQLYGSSSLAEKQRMVEKAENDMKQQAQQQMQAQQQQVQQQLQMQQQIAQQQIEAQKQMKKEENETKIKVAQIEAMTKYETTEHQDPQQFADEMEEKRRQFDEQLDFNKDKFAFDKQKHTEDNNLKRELAGMEAASGSADRAQREAQSVRSESNKLYMSERKMSEGDKTAKKKK